MEIERKFKVRRLPEHLDRYPVSHIRQAYLCREPVVRVRQQNESFWLTCKGKGLFAREEFELPMDKKAFEHLLSKADGNIVTKNRYAIPFAGKTIALDVFCGDLAPLVLAEVEFASEDEGLAFVPPDWFGEDVTLDSAYSNSNLSVKGVKE